MTKKLSPPEQQTELTRQKVKFLGKDISNETMMDIMTQEGKRAGELAKIQESFVAKVRKEFNLPEEVSEAAGENKG
jgi:hypothetical protein